MDAIAPPLTGIGRYALYLALGLRQHDAVQDTRFFSGYRWIDDPGQAQQANRLLAAMRHYVPFKSLALTVYFQARQAIFKQRTRKLKSYLLHTPNYLLFPHDGPSVATIHDLSYIHFPQFHPQERIQIMNREMPKTLKLANHFITDSEFVRQEVIAHYGLSPETVTAVPLGVDPVFRPRCREETLSVLLRYGIADKPYLLVVGTLEPRKNLARLLVAYANLPKTLRDTYPIVIVGVKGWLTDDIERVAAPLENAGHVRRLGYVSGEDLPSIYAAAHAFAFPSIYEGFGLPPLEAMASGIPVLVSDVSSMPEVVGGAGLLVAPDDVDQLTYNVERLLVDADFRRRARLDGISRAAGFTWQRCVDQTVDVYSKVCGV